MARCLSEGLAKKGSHLHRMPILVCAPHLCAIRAIDICTVNEPVNVLSKYSVNLVIPNYCTICKRNAQRCSICLQFVHQMLQLKLGLTRMPLLELVGLFIQSAIQAPSFWRLCRWWKWFACYSHYHRMEPAYLLQCLELVLF